MPGAFAPTDDWLYRHIVEDSPARHDLRDAASFCDVEQRCGKHPWTCQARDWEFVEGVEEQS